MVASKDSSEALNPDQLEALRADIGDLKIRVGGLETDVAEIKARVGRLEVDVGDIKVRVGRLETDMGWVKSSLGRVESRLDRIETACGGPSPYSGQHPDPHLPTPGRYLMSFRHALALSKAV